MQIYKELIFYGNKVALDLLFSDIYNYFSTDWIKPKNNHFLQNYIVADYVGSMVPHAELTIYYGDKSWRDGYIQVGNIVPLEKEQLTIEEYNTILDIFYADIIVPYLKDHTEIKVQGPTSDKFNPLDFITEKALQKLEAFCNSANKSTGSSHPSDEARWFDFICQTVEDEKVFDYDMLFKFLTDEDYWGSKDEDFIGVIGHFAWAEDKASELAMEYENYVRILQFYKQKYEDIES